MTKQKIENDQVPESGNGGEGVAIDSAQKIRSLRQGGTCMRQQLEREREHLDNIDKLRGDATWKTDTGTK